MNRETVVRILSKLVFYLLTTYGEQIEDWVDSELQVLIAKTETKASALSQ